MPESPSLGLSAFMFCVFMFFLASFPMFLRSAYPRSLSSSVWFYFCGGVLFFFPRLLGFLVLHFSVPLPRYSEMTFLIIRYQCLSSFFFRFFFLGYYCFALAGGSCGTRRGLFWLLARSELPSACEVCASHAS